MLAGRRSTRGTGRAVAARHRAGLADDGALRVRIDGRNACCAGEVSVRAA
jgi:hypothetical protein